MPKTPKPQPHRSLRCALRAVARAEVPHSEANGLSTLAKNYLDGDYSFFGVQREDLVRLLLENAGVDVDAMLKDYRTSM